MNKKLLHTTPPLTFYVYTWIKNLWRRFINRHISPTFCVYPWMELIVGPTEHITLCCVAESPVLDSKNSAYTCSKDRLKDYWNSEGLREIRKKMLAGEKISACNHCDYQESIGRISFRESANKQWLLSSYGREILERVDKSRSNGYRVEEPPLYLDIRPGNLCNLSCRMCNPGSSSKIYKEQKDLLKKDELFQPLIDDGHFRQDEKHFHNWYKNEKIWEDVYEWSSVIKQLYFTGGEPTLIKENWRLIDYLIKKDFAENIDLIFNINCTQAPDKLINTFSRFKSVCLNFSIDGYREIQEYIRHPSKWQEVESNVIKLLKNKKTNCSFFLTPAVQVYNILNLVDIFNWRDELKKTYTANIGICLSMCTNPEYLDIQNLPANVKKSALSKIASYKEKYEKKDLFFLNNLSAVENVLKREEPDNLKAHLKNFFRYTHILDKHRSNDFSKSLPELNNLLNQDGRWKS